MLRFKKVFKQTCTRFPDLQKAEAQAREAQIEVALEKVRSQFLGLHRREDLLDVIRVLFEQMVQLNYEINNIGFLMEYRKTDDYSTWMAGVNADYPTIKHFPYFYHPFNRDYPEHRGDNGPELFTKIYSFEEKNS